MSKKSKPIFSYTRYIEKRLFGHGGVYLLYKKGQDILGIQYENGQKKPRGHTICPRDLDPTYMVTYYIEGSRLLGQTIEYFSSLIHMKSGFVYGSAALTVCKKLRC